MAGTRSGIFPGRGWAHTPAELAGRGEDLAVLRAFVYGLSAQGGAVLLTGEPGTGKSALLDATQEIAAAAGIRVLRAAGAESADDSFFALNQLLLPLRGLLDRLDNPQQDALNVAVGFRDGPAHDPLVVSNAALALLRAAASEDRPLLLIVDNLQWVDQASVQVFAFVARRLPGSRVGILVAERTGASRLSGLGLPDHEVLPLNDDASVALVAHRFPDLAPAVRRRIVTEARGNPLALLELPAGLSDPQRSGLDPLPPVLPLSRRLRAAFSSPVAALPAAARYLLLLAVLEGTGHLGLLRAAAAPHCEIDDLAPAERAGLVRVDGAIGRMVFSHPLVRSAVMELSASGEVRKAHRALAAQLRDQPERSVWHLAGAALEADADVAGLLERLARQALDRGDANGGVAALIRAARLSPAGVDRGRLLAEAAYLSAAVTGELPRVPRLLREARQAAPVPGGSAGSPGSPGSGASLHAAAADACLRLNGGDDIDTVHRLLTDALGASRGEPRSSGRALTAALETLLMVCAEGERADLWRSFEEALRAHAADGRDELNLLTRTLADPARSAIGVLGQLDAAIAGLSAETDHRRTLALGAAAARTDRLAGCREALWRVARDGPEGGAVLPALTALNLLCHDGLQAGAWDEAWELAEECLRACQSYGYAARAWRAREHLAMIAAARGDDPLVRELTREMSQWAAPRGITAALMAVHRARSLTALGRGDFEEAYREAAAISSPGELASHVPDALPAVFDLVEAAIRSGRREEAAAHVAAARAARIAEISPRLALLVTASAAFAASAGRDTGGDNRGDRPGRLFEQALGIRGAERYPFEFARVRLAYGEHLRRTRAASDARAQLDAALAAFRALGARPWADRAANELRAARLIPARTENNRVTALTAQERQIVSLAATGLSNKEIGQRLYLSPRTVSSHLYRVFPKLGVSSRASLRDALIALNA
jgi:DNA-binding CsgD family transcriptional regulator